MAISNNVSGQHGGGIMANYLFIRGSRNKYFFPNVASELEKKGHKCYQLKFELGELWIRSSIEAVFVPSHLSKKEFPISNEELLDMEIYNVTYKKEMKNKETSKKELQMYKRYMFFIDQFIDEHEIDVVCMFNGYHWIDRITTVLARQKKVETLFFEQGYFRPFTLTCDPNGINDLATIPRHAEFYKSLSWDKNRLNKYLLNPEIRDFKDVEGENLTQVAIIKAASMLGSFLRVNPNLYAHITFFEAVKYFMFKQVFKFRKPDTRALPKEYIFVPFQVSRDTQIFYSSSIKSMEQLVDLLYANVESLNRKLNRNIHLVFKEHPEDMPRNNYKALKKRYASKQNVMFVQKRSVSELIQKSLAVITINSTVGIEALAQYKRVITLGKAFYNIEGIVTHCKHHYQLDRVIEEVLQKKVNETLISQFLYYLRFHYQIEGDLISPNNKTAQIVASYIDANYSNKEKQQSIKE